MDTGPKGKAGPAILALTETGATMGKILAQARPGSRLYMPRRLKPVGEPPLAACYFDDWEEAFDQAFHHHEALICIMAAGIVVRSLAPRLQSKFVDPAVVVVDEKGRHAISLLSGHIGGANRLAREVAEILKGEAVITTATDVQGQPAVDLLAGELEARVEPLEKLTLVNRLLAEKKTVYLYSPWSIIPSLRRGFVWQGWPAAPGADKGLSDALRFNAGRFLPPAVLISPHGCWAGDDRTLIQIKPRNLAVGIGARKGVGGELIERAVRDVVSLHQLDPACIRTLASIDFKAREAGMQKAAEVMGLPLKSFSKQEIMTLEGTYPGSAWVEETIGVGGVCEPAAVLAAGRGITLVPKQKRGAVTVSIAMEKSWWWDWDREDANI